MSDFSRRDFLLSGGAIALITGCASDGDLTARNPSRLAKSGFYVFSKAFQSPVTESPEKLCELIAGAGYDGVQWTVRRGGHVSPEHVKEQLPHLCKIAKTFGLACETICTDISPGNKQAESVLKTAADCGVIMQRPAYFFYDSKSETFRQAMERIKRGFAWLANLAEETGVKATYQNHAAWDLTLFGGLVWDIYECVKDLDPALIGVEYDPMHAFCETGMSWLHGLELIAPWISAIDLKDFHYRTDPVNSKKMVKVKVAAGDGIVPWDEVRRALVSHKISVPFIVHFEYDFDKTDLHKMVKGELAVFKAIFQDLVAKK